MYPLTKHYSKQLMKYTHAQHFDEFRRIRPLDQCQDRSIVVHLQKSRCVH